MVHLTKLLKNIVDNTHFSAGHAYGPKFCHVQYVTILPIVFPLYKTHNINIIFTLTLIKLSQKLFNIIYWEKVQLGSWT